MCVRCKGSHRRAGRLTEPDRGHSRESSCSYRTLGRVWTVNILRTDWTLALLHSRIRDDAESVPLWHSKQKQLQVIWVYKERPLGKLWRNQLETAEKSRKENSFSATTLTPLSSNPNTSTLLPTTLQNRAETPDDSWLLSKVSGSQALQPPQLYKHLAGSSRLFPQLEGKHQKWWVER